MSKIFEGLDKAASRQIQNIVRQNPKGSADEKMLLQRYIKTPMVQDFNLSPEEWIGQATKWLAANQQNIKKNYPEVDTSNLIDLATKMYEDFLAMQGQLEEAVIGPALGAMAGYNLASDDPSDPSDIGTSWRVPGLGSEDDIPATLAGAYAGNKLQKWLADPENRDKLKRKFGPDASPTDVVPEVPVDSKPVKKQRKKTSTKDTPTTEKPRVRVNPQTGALEPVQTDKPKTTRTPKVTSPKSSLPSLDAEPGRTIGGGYQDARTWRNVGGDAAKAAGKVASKTPIGRKLAGLGAAAGIVGGIGSQMYAGIEDKFKDLIGKDADKPKPDTKTAPATPPKAPPAQTSVLPPPPPASSTTPEPETDILGAPGADVSEPTGPIDRDKSTDVVIPQRPKKIEYDQPEMPFENTDAVTVPQPSSGAIKKVAKTIGKGILPAATALTVGDDYKDLQKRLGSKDYTGAALRGVATTTGLIPHLGAQAVSAGAEGLLAMKDNPEYFKNYKPTSSIGRGIKEGYSAGAVGGTGIDEGDAPPKAKFNPKPMKKGPGTSKDDYEYTDYVPRGKEDKEAWAIKRTVDKQKLKPKKQKELDTGFYKNYLGNRPLREEEIDEAGGRLGAINTVAQLFKSIAKGGDPVDMDIQQRQMNALMRKYNIDYKDIGIKKPTPQQSPSSTMKPGQQKPWHETLPSFDNPAKGTDYKKWEPNPIEENDMDEGIGSAIKGGTKRIATMRKYFAGDETAKDPTDISIQRAWFADPKNQWQIQPKPNKPPQPVKEYDANLINQIAAANKIKNPDLIYPGQKITLPSGDTYVVKKGDTLGDIVYNRPVQSEPVATPVAEPKISNRYPDSGLSPDSKFVDVRNNPGNLRGTDALRKPGYVLDKAVGFDKNGFAIFANPEDGKEAMRRQLALDALKRGLTGRQLINKYAPPSDNNNTDAYIKNTFGELGLDPDSKISPEDLEKIQRLMVRQEHGKEGMNFYYPQNNQMVAKVNEMEILQRFLDKNADKNKQDKPVANPNAVYKKPGAPKSAPHDISQPEEPVEVPGHPLERDRPKLDAEVQKRLQQLQPQKTKESSILKGIKGHKF